jgi:hypothetical protein
VLVTPALIKSFKNEGIAEKELTVLLNSSRVIPILYGVTFDDLYDVSPMLSESCKGGGAAAARAALERAMRQHHARPTAAQLDEKARRLVNGERIGVTSRDFRLGADLPRAAAAAEEIVAARQVVTGQAPAGRRVDGPDGAFTRASARSL